MRILGISAFYHDSAACLLVDGELVAAAQEERFTRKKHDYDFPRNAVAYCLREAGIQTGDLDLVAFYDKPLLKFERLLETYLAFAPRGFTSFLAAMPLWTRQKLFLADIIRKELKWEGKILYPEHHESHAAAAFFPSPYDEAAILTTDGVGEWTTTSYGVGEGNRVRILADIKFPHSLGMLYSAFTYFTGFRVNSGEYKVMGLAPYGEPKYVDVILKELIDLRDDGSFKMNMDFFDYCTGLRMTNKRFAKLFGGPEREAESKLTQREMDLAASVQVVTEMAMLRMARHIRKATGKRYLCLAGGVALNCVGNGRILREGPFDRIWIQPAAGDAGGALGVALFIWHQLLDKPRTPQPSDSQQGSFLGAEYSDQQVGEFLAGTNAAYERLDDDDALCDRIAEALAAGKVVGWFQGRMEFGPRALGSRSILGDARSPQMQSKINLKVKFREGFRPFAPVVLEEHAHEYFDSAPGASSPYMLLVAPVRDEKRLPLSSEAQGIDKLRQTRSLIPAVTHVDYSARFQTVDRQRHGLLRKLMERFHAQTGCPVMVNTSFNLGWEPIVRSPREAYETFMTSDIEVLCLGHFVLTKEAQKATVRVDDNPAVDPVLDGRLASPCCSGALARRDGSLLCERCGHAFSVSNNIPQLFWPHEGVSSPADVTEMVKAFYEETPFPNYDDHDSARSLIEKSRRGVYARRLNETVPYNSAVLEVGCGTGQLSNFLGMACRQVIGTDMCLNSLKLGEAFRERHGLARVRFMQMNLFRPAFAPEQFDVVLCNGVLHHTADPHGGFRTILQLVKPGGHIVIGLYNTYGRLLTDLRRQLFRATGNRAKWIDPILRRRDISGGKFRAWFADQYQNPHESKHTMGEVLRWFDEAGVDFVRGIPALRPDDDGLEGESLFAPQPRGSTLDHGVVQAMQILAGQKEGGFFIMIGRKPEGSGNGPR